MGGVFIFIAKILFLDSVQKETNTFFWLQFYFEMVPKLCNLSVFNKRDDLARIFEICKFHKMKNNTIVFYQFWFCADFYVDFTEMPKNIFLCPTTIWQEL
jgi:hypothetical protein